MEFCTSIGIGDAPVTVRYSTEERVKGVRGDWGHYHEEVTHVADIEAVLFCGIDITSTLIQEAWDQLHIEANDHMRQEVEA